MSTFLPRKQLNLDFARMALLSGDDYPTELSKLDSLINFSRASAGSRFNASGLLESVASGHPRFDFDPATLLPRGLLLEEQQTNYVLWNRDLTNAQWSKTGTGVTISRISGIDGATSSASRVALGGANGEVSSVIACTVAAGNKATLSFWAKGSGTLHIFIWGANGTYEDSYSAWALVTLNASWTKYSLTYSWVYAHTSIGIEAVHQAGATTTQVDIDMVQLEVGPGASSSIPTTTSTVTRAADVASITQLSPWFDPSKWTWVIEAQLAGALSISAGLLHFGPNSNPDIYNFNSQLRAELYDGTHDAAVFPGAAVNTPLKFAASWLQNTSQLAACLNGGTVQSAGYAGTVAGTSVTLGALAGGTCPLNGWLKRVAYLQWKVSDGLLQALST